jgi:hypothetical protein
LFVGWLLCLWADFFSTSLQRKAKPAPKKQAFPKPAGCCCV